MRTIVAPVNFSASSDNAARYAADMALAINADLHLIHIVEVAASAAEMPMTDYLFDEMQKNGAEGLQELRAELVARTGGKVNIFTDPEVGGVERRLEEFCTEKIPFVVIVGNSGHSLERILIGSNVAGIIRRLPYPFIVVPENAVFHQIGKIVLACDLDDIAAGIPVAVSFLKELQSIFKAAFEIININTGKEAGQRKAQRSSEFNSWQKRLQDIYPEVHFVRMDKVEEGISKYLEGQPADLLLVFPKKHGVFEFHKSLAKKITLHSPVPVMSIHGSGFSSDLLFS